MVLVPAPLGQAGILRILIALSPHTIAHLLLSLQMLLFPLQMLVVLLRNLKVGCRLVELPGHASTEEHFVQGQPHEHTCIDCHD